MYAFISSLNHSKFTPKKQSQSTLVLPIEKVYDGSKLLEFTCTMQNRAGMQTLHVQLTSFQWNWIYASHLNVEGLNRRIIKKMNR